MDYHYPGINPPQEDWQATSIKSTGDADKYKPQGEKSAQTLNNVAIFACPSLCICQLTYRENDLAKYETMAAGAYGV